MSDQISDKISYYQVMSSIVEYLTATKKTLGSSCPAKLHVVLGNEACDLDSAVSALVYAFLLHSLLKEEEEQEAAEEGRTVVVVPVLNIPRRDYELRTEVTYWLDKHQIRREDLVFRDEVELTERHRADGLQLTLVDHNLLPAADAHLDPAVVNVLDHHKLERQSGSVSGSMVVEMVGSCCTLVAEKLRVQKPSLLDPVIASLLYGTIILDTVNLSEAAKRVTPKDVNIIQRLKPLICPTVERDQLFQELTSAKMDVSGLTPEQLLRKDVKVATGKSLTVGVASLPMMVKEYLRRPSIATCLSEHSIAQGYDVLVVMGYSIVGEMVTRDIAVFSGHEDLRSQLVSHLCEAQGGLLQLEAMDSGIDGCSAFQQRNAAASRKVVLPIVKDWLELALNNH